MPRTPRWTREEDAAIRRAAIDNREQGITVKELWFTHRDELKYANRLRVVANRLGRSYDAVRKRAERIGATSYQRRGRQSLRSRSPNTTAEFVDGALHTLPRPSTLQALAKSRLGACLSHATQFGRSGSCEWWIIDEPELHLDEDILVPDLVGWHRQRLSDYPDTAYFTLAPDWVCEVLSASTRRLDLHGKRPVYAREGVRHLWLVDPVDRTLEAFELHEGQWLLIGSAKDEDPVSIRPFEAITFRLGNLWPQ